MSPVILFLGGCAGTNTDIPEGVAALPTADQSSNFVAPLSEYRLGALDQVRVNVFREPELSVDNAVVDVAGKLNLPVVGEVSAYGRTVNEVGAEVAQRLNARYLRGAQVSVSVTKPSSYVFTVEGEVKRPGTYPIPGRVTLLQALAMGEGVSQMARLTDVVVFRSQDGKRYAARFDVRDIREARAIDPELRSGDIVVVGYSAAKQIYRDIVAALPGLAGVFVAIAQN